MIRKRVQREGLLALIVGIVTLVSEPIYSQIYAERHVLAILGATNHQEIIGMLEKDLGFQAVHETIMASFVTIMLLGIAYLIHRQKEPRLSIEAGVVLVTVVVGVFIAPLGSILAIVGGGMALSQAKKLKGRPDEIH